MRAPIRILSEDVSNKIAAGEVIERPASIVKELVENAIDAGARRIRVEVRGGGKELIRVVDDGSGVPADEAHLVFMRHATSKISTASDLFHISTLGFRGEALPSIASVARVEFVTRTPDADDGILLKVEGHKIASSPCGAPVGTQVTVTDLFYNTPARFKFLKSDTTERRFIADVLTAIALAHPGIAFRLVMEGREVLNTAGSGNLKETLGAVYGRRILQGLVPVEGLAPWGGVFGYVGKPDLAKGNRSGESVFVNGRWVQNRMLYAAIEKGYESLLAHRRFPLAVLHISIDPSLVDVNVHPAKTEIRFRDESDVFRTVMKAVRSALLQADLVSPLGEPRAPGPAGRPAKASVDDAGLQPNLAWSFPPLGKESSPPRRAAGEPPAPVWVGEERGTYALPPQLTAKDDTASHLVEPIGAQEGDHPAHSVGEPPPHATLPLAASEAERARVAMEQGSASHGYDPRELLATAEVAGQLAATYLLVPVPFGLWLIDQHVAHERVLYEKALARWEQSQVVSQQLLTPYTLRLTPALAATLMDHLDAIEAMGFGVEPFGGNDFLLRAVPPEVTGRPEPVLTQIVEELAHIVSEGGPSRKERAAAALACRAAIKAGERLHPEVMRHLIRELATVENPYACPHGRPIIVQIDLKEIERRFGRS